MAPTPTTWCATSLPSSSRMVSTTEYSHAPPSDGWRILPSTLSGVMVFDGCASGESKRSEEHTSELQSLMRISYAVFCLKKKKKRQTSTTTTTYIVLHLSIEQQGKH